MTEMKNCLVCGKEFKPCNTCNKSIDENLQWRRVVCCQEHFYYHIPIIEYIRGVITKSEAKAELESVINKYGQIEFVDNIKSVVQDIMTVDKKSKKSAVSIDTEVKTEDVSNDI